MICRSCGGESRGSFCAFCGAPLVNEAFAKEGEIPPAVVKTTPISSAVPAKQKRQRERKTDKTARRAAFLRGEERIRLRQVFFPALAFFLPLLYLFVDVFALYAEGLFATAEGESLFFLLIARLADSAFAYNPVFDIITATYGEAIEPLSFMGISGALAAGGSYAFYAALLAVSAIASAACGLLVIVTLGRILYNRIMTDLIVCVGFFSAAVPFVIDLLARFQSPATCLSTARVHYTVEAWLIAAILICLLVPAVRALRRAAGGGFHHVTLAYRMTGRLGGKSLVRVLAVIFAIAAMALSLVPLFLPVGGETALLSTFLTTFSTVHADIDAVLAVFSGGSAFVAIQAIARLAVLVLLPLTLLFSTFSVLALLRLLSVRPRKVAEKKRYRRRLAKTGKVLRRPTWLFLVFQLLAEGAVFLTVFLGSGVKMHLTSHAIQETLSLFYLTALYVREFCGVLSLGALLLFLSFVCATVSGNLAKTFIRLAQGEENP